MADYGYDVADYCDVDPIFGSLSDAEALIAACHARGLRILVDFVPNHTSSQHPWFLEALRGKHSTKRDWYIWQDPAPGGGPPNNWLAISGGSAWEFDGTSGQFYLHSFLKEQPDLNWRNPAVKAAMFDVMRFWLRRGVDGFRVDVIGLLLKDEAFRDNPVNLDYIAGAPDFERFHMVHNAYLAETVDLCTEMRGVLSEFAGDKLLIGELYLPVEQLMPFYGANLDAVHLPFNFNLIGVEWSASGLENLIRRYEGALPEGAWPNWVTGNHDRPRVASRVGIAQTRAAMILLLTLRGTPTIYNGEELGLPDADIPDGIRRDPFEPNRDPCRTPMPWDETCGAGFSMVEPWLPIGEAHRMMSIERQAMDSDSMLALTRDLLALRRAEPALSIGALHLVDAGDGVLAYRREAPGRRLIVLVNPGECAREASLDGRGFRVRLASDRAREGAALDYPIALRPGEAMVLAEAQPAK